MDWQGELAPAVEVLAAQVGLIFREIGARPVPPILVSLTGVDESLGEFLRAAGLQAGTRADVAVSSNAVEVIYHAGVATDGR